MGASRRRFAHLTACLLPEPGVRRERLLPLLRLIDTELELPLPLHLQPRRYCRRPMNQDTLRHAVGGLAERRCSPHLKMHIARFQIGCTVGCVRYSASRTQGQTGRLTIPRIRWAASTNIPKNGGSILPHPSSVGDGPAVHTVQEWDTVRNLAYREHARCGSPQNEVQAAGASYPPPTCIKQQIGYSVDGSSAARVFIYPKRRGSQRRTRIAAPGAQDWPPCAALCAVSRHTASA
ncbi:hypothetical protein EJ06DRAFT_100659 [Trichodelitschia bisporula]|uniref:Uncharacterized protein n=1 Tax=Trichodelitschia bisporula TaxID=703511 RepID=A0A6G1HR56_9PEZI|nr:hypothetical protein EJ06DRAFT_100659 [Trichodelitschia bisporula]